MGKGVHTFSAETDANGLPLGPDSSNCYLRTTLDTGDTYTLTQKPSAL
jgi:hypothetical protein